MGWIYSDERTLVKVIDIMMFMLKEMFQYANDMGDGLCLWSKWSNHCMRVTFNIY